jgi:hypothetical protein
VPVTTANDLAVRRPFAASYDPELTITGVLPGADLPAGAQLSFTTTQNGTMAVARISITSDDPLPSGEINLAALELAKPIQGESGNKLLAVTVEDVNGVASSGSSAGIALKLQIPNDDAEILSGQIGQSSAGHWQVNFSTEDLDQNPNARIRVAIPAEKLADPKEENAPLAVTDTDHSDADKIINDFRIAIVPELEEAKQAPSALTNTDRWKLKFGTDAGDANHLTDKIRIPRVKLATVDIPQHLRI